MSIAVQNNSDRINYKITYIKIDDITTTGATVLLRDLKFKYRIVV